MIDENFLLSVGDIHPIRKTVTYYVSLADDDFEAAATVRGVTRRPKSKTSARTVEAEVEYDEQEWCFWTKYLGGIVPKQGDKFVLSGVYWHVHAVSTELAGARHVLTCRQGRA